MSDGAQNTHSSESVLARISSSSRSSTTQLNYFPLNRHPFTLHSSHRSRHCQNVQEVGDSICTAPGRLRIADVSALYSGIARSVRASAFRQPLTARRAFQPIKKNFAPALSARFASTDSGLTGKIHQVIGAVVDGTENPCHSTIAQPAATCWASHYFCQTHINWILTDFLCSQVRHRHSSSDSQRVGD